MVLAAAGEHTCELEVVIVRHRASGWVREIARKSEDQVTEAEFDPETGIVTVYEGRREFRELERAARRAGYGKKRVPEYVPYRMLEVEAAANAVYAWAAEQILARRLPEERPSDGAEYAAAVRHEAQALRHRAHHKLMQAFLEPEIFEGAVTLRARMRSQAAASYGWSMTIQAADDYTLSVSAGAPLARDSISLPKPRESTAKSADLKGGAG